MQFFAKTKSETASENDEISFFPELQTALNLKSLDFTPEGPLKIVVSRSVSRNLPESPIGRDGWDVLSYPEVITPSETYSIYFDSIISYTVGDEVCIQAGNEGEFEGRQFRRYKKSRYLSYIEDSSNGLIDTPPRGASHYHYGIYCLNQLIEVITPGAPKIAFLGLCAG